MKQFLKRAAGVLLCMAMLAASAAFTVSAQEDITADPMTFQINQSTISGSATVDPYDWCMTVKKGGYVEYTVNTEQSASFTVSVEQAPSKTGALMSVSVNGTEQISNVELVNQGSYAKFTHQTLGIIVLTPGANVIRFSVPTSSNDVTVFKWFTLTKTGDVYYIPITKPDDVDAYQEGEGNPANTGWYPKDNPNLMIMRGASSDKCSWIEKTINVKQAGVYGVTVNLGAATGEAGFALKASAGGRSTQRAVEPTGSYSTYQNRFIGNLYLAAGEQTVRLQVASTTKAAFVKSMTLGEPQSDFINDACEINVTPSNITASSGYTENDADLSYDWCVNLRGSKSFTVSVYAEKALSYLITGRYGASKAGQSFDVSVNGYKQIEKAPAEYTDGSYSCVDGRQIGVVNLNRGLNEITFSLGAGSDNAIVMDKLQLTLADSFQEGEFKAWVQEKRVPDYYFGGGNGGFYTAGEQKCATIRGGGWVEYDVYTTQERIVSVLIDIASSENVSFSASVNGEAQISNESIGKPSSGYTTFATVASAGILTIPAGHSVIRYTQEAGAANLRSLTFEEANRNEALITNFEIQNADGSRMPYAMRDGLKGYAAVTIKKLGNATDDRMKLIIAQYANDTSLIGVSESRIDVSEMANRETKEFKTELTLKGEGGYVKAFLMREETFEPLSKAQSYAETQIFPDNVLETSVTSELATNVLNNDGANYAEYGLHDSTYDIDAIFYTGYNNTKVFAYVGVPKSATSANKVPAMVLVHGGVGKAERSWVQKWNDLGYAAIAMDLYGCGPEDDPDSYSGSKKKKHPYAGVAPWDFSANFKNAGMYQTVINVVNAHTLLRGMDKIDSSRIGITGISWGGITTTTVAGVDDRFMFAIPVYGCGYLDQCKTYFGSKFDSASQSIAWDPANFVAKAQMPVMFVNSDADAHFSINSSSLSYGVVKDGYLSIHHGLSHSQGAGDSIKQVYDFADNMFKGKNPYIIINGATAENGVLTADCTIPSGTSVVGVTMYYIKDAELPANGGDNIKWTAVTEYSENNGTVTVNIPAGATYVYASITDNNGAIMSTKFLKVK